jgi:hypothetical protein
MYMYIFNIFLLKKQAAAAARSEVLELRELEAGLSRDVASLRDELETVYIYIYIYVYIYIYMFS